MVIVGIISLIFITFVFGANKSFALCQEKASCYSPHDYGATNPLCQTEEYEPCDSWMLWDVYFTRTEQWSQTAIQYNVFNAGWSRTYSTLIYPDQGPYHFSGSQYIGSTTNHILDIRRISGPSGAFDELTLAVRYVADDPTK